MTGYIKLSNTTYEGEAGVTADVHLKDVNMLDKVVLLDAFFKAIEIESMEEIAMLLALRDMVYKSGGAKVVKVEMPNLKKGGEDN